MFGQSQGLLLKAKAKAKTKDSKFVLEDSSRPRTKAKDNNTVPSTVAQTLAGLCMWMDGYVCPRL